MEKTAVSKRSLALGEYARLDPGRDSWVASLMLGLEAQGGPS